jgi:hypothetical protein
MKNVGTLVKGNKLNTKSRILASSFLILLFLAGSFAVLMIAFVAFKINNARPTPTLSLSPTHTPFITFVDKNNLLAINFPADWTYTNGSTEKYYYDTFTSADGSAKIESLVYNDGEPFVAGQNGKFALGLLHQIYSNTGKEGDITISGDSIQPDGSERLTWSSKSGGYSGFSFFELRGEDNHTFLMLTAWWTDDSDQANIDAINAAIASYRLP